MNRRHVDAIESLGLLSESLDDGLRLRHVARSTHLQHARQAHETPPTVIYVLLAVATADSWRVSNFPWKVENTLLTFFWHHGKFRTRKGKVALFIYDQTNGVAPAINFRARYPYVTHSPHPPLKTRDNVELITIWVAQATALLRNTK